MPTQHLKHQRCIFSTLLFTCFFIWLTPLLTAAEDIYHAGLREMLKTEHGISGGRWLLGDNEATTMSHAVWSKVAGEIIRVDNQPYTRTLRLTTEQFQPHSWDAYVRFPASAVKPGDVLLLMVWVRAQEAVSPIHVFEAQSPPYAKSLNRAIPTRSEWRLWMLPFTAQTGDGRYQINLGGIIGTVELSTPAILNFEQRYRTYELPVNTSTFAYEGREEGAPWRAAALQRIETLRKGELTIKVIDQAGQAVKGAVIEAKMKRHAFGFGTAITVEPWLQPSADGNTYLTKLTNLDGRGRGFNVAVFENALKWPPWEDESAHGTKDQVTQIARWLYERNLRLRGHTLLWPTWGAMPPDMKLNSGNPDYLTNRIRTHFINIMRHDGLREIVGEWDVLNEPVGCRDLEAALAGDGIYTDAFFWAQTANDYPRLFVNENEILGQAGSDSLAMERFKAIVTKIKSAGAPLDGIGVQGHMKNGLVPPTRLLKIFDELAEFGVDLAITEYDAAGVDPEIAAEYMRDILIATFSHPSATQFVMWGFWDGAHWQNDAPIFNRDWSLKPSGAVFVDWVLNKWWSEAQGVGDDRGLWTMRGFYGDYEINVRFRDAAHSQTMTFDPDHRVLTVVLNLDLTPPEPPTGLVLYQNYPNPFSEMTRIPFGLSSGAAVHFQVFNSEGDTVIDRRSRYDDGWHEILIELGALSSGVYYYRLHDGHGAQTRKMLLIK